MRNVSFSSLIARNVADAATSAPATTPATTETKPAKPARVLKPRAAKPAAPVAAKPASKPAVKLSKPAKPETAKPSANVTRTAATIAAGACNFGNLSDRDTAYVTFYASLAKAAANGVVTLRAIVDSGKRPAYSGSNKPHDAGVIQRIEKAGLVTTRDGGNAFVFTKQAHTHAAFVRGYGKPA